MFLLIFFSLLFFALFCSNDNDNVSESDRGSSASAANGNINSIMTDRAVDIQWDGTLNIDLFNSARKLANV